MDGTIPMRGYPLFPVWGKTLGGLISVPGLETKERRMVFSQPNISTKMLLRKLKEIETKLIPLKQHFPDWVRHRRPLWTALPEPFGYLRAQPPAYCIEIWRLEDERERIILELSKRGKLPIQTERGDEGSPSISKSVSDSAPSAADKHIRSREAKLTSTTPVLPVIGSGTADQLHAPPRTEAFTHSEDYRSVRLNGTQFTLTLQQAQVIQILHGAFEKGTPDIGTQFILEKIESPNSRLRDSFKSNQEAWKALIRQGKKRGTIRLNI